MGFIALQRAKLHYVFENIFHVVERLVSEKEAKMNKIFKVIWSKSKQCYVVVSELAKNTTGKKKIVVASIFAAMVAGQAMQVDATSGSFYDTGAIKGAIAIGKAGSTAPQATDENAIAIGQAARANGRGGVALGNDTRSAQNAIAAAWDSQATGKNSVAVGTGTRATGLSSTAVGDGAQATANGAVALGQSTESAGNSVAAGFNAKARSNNTIAIGVEANNDGSITNNASSVSVGVATRARAVGSMAMGVSADASGKYSLALGSGDVSGDYTDGTNHPSASGEKSIAIGHNSNASDESAIAIGSSSISDKTSATALGRNTTATGVNSSAIGAYSIASATDATALGRNANATAGQSTALGTYSVASGQYGTGVGYQANASGANSTAVGVSAKANKDGASAMGPGARAYGNGAISLGYQALSGANIFNSTNGSFNDASADVTNYAKWGDAAIGLRAIASGGNATALGRSATATAANAIAIGGGNGDSATDNKEKTEATGEKSTAIGYNAKAKTGNDLAVGRGVTSSGGAATALGYYATASGNQTVALGSTINSTAQYATGIGYSVNSQGEGSVAIGAGTDALGAIPAKQVQATAKNAIAIGRATQATSQDATAIGTDATASNTDAIAIGRKSNASGSTSIGFGYNTKSTATNTVAIGTDVSATAESAIALGRKTTASALNATAVGPIANASGKYSSAFGMSAAASKENSLALGTNANASLDKSVALGSDSTTATNATSQGSVVIGGKTITWNGAPTVSGTGMQVSVGAAGAERQIKNVAAGAVSANSTDAINGSQLYAVAESLRTKYVSINSTETNNQNNDGAIGSNSMAIGPNASANNTNSMAIGPSASAIKSNSMAIGPNASSKEENSVAIGPNASATGKDSVVVGVNSQVTSSNSVAFGNSALAKQNYNVAMGSEVTADGDNSVAMGRMASSTGMASLAIGAYGYNKSTASGKYSIAIGRDVTSSAEDAIAMGRNSQATANYALALGAEANASQASGVALGYSSTANTASGVAGYNPNTGHSDTYTALSGKTLTSTLGAVSVGNATNTRQITGVAAGKADTDAVNVAQLKSVNLAFTGNSGSGDVNLSKSKLAVEGGTDSFITTTAANKKLEINTTQGKLKTTSGTVSVDGNNGLAVAQNVADVINQANADRTITYKANGTGSNSVKLSDGLNFTNGTTTTATVGANGQVTFDLNTTTQKSITDSATAVARTISLGGDTGTTTAKSLTSSNVNFGVKSGSPTYLTTTANGNDVTLTINEQAIKNAAKDASSFKVKANATAAEDVKGGDTVAFNNGDNIAITQTGKTFKIATAKNVTFDAATIGGNTTIGSTGITTNKVTVGTVSIDGTNGINAGNKAITNVGTGRVANSNADNSNVANIGDVKAIATDAVANLSTNLGITDGTNSGTVNLKNQSLKVVGTGVAKATVNGQTITVDVAKGTLTNNTTTGALTGTAGVVDANDMATAVNTAITKAVDTATGTQKLDISAGGTDSSVNLKTQKLTVTGTGAATASLTGQTITVNVAEGTFTNKSDGTTSATAGVAKATDVAAAINNTNTVLGNKITAATQSLSTLGDNKFKLTADSTSTTGQALNKSGGLSFKIAGDGDLVSTSATTDTINVTVKKGTLTNAADGSLNVTDSGVVTADNMKSVVNDAITKAVTSAKDGSAWNISTNGGTATKVSGGNTVDLINGDNIEITQDGTDGKKITVKTKKDLTLDSVTAANTVKVGSGTNLITLDGTTGGVSGNTFTAGNASMNTTGFRLTGGPSVTTTGIDAGNKVITNVASGGTTSTNAANIGDINAAISSLTTNLGKNTTIAYKANNAGGQTVSLADGFNFTNGTLTTAEVAANGVVKFNVTQGSLSTDGNGNITNTTGVATTDDVKNAVNTAITKAVDNATGTQKLDISAGGTDSSVNLKTQKLTVAGTGAATASLNGQTITVDVAQGTFTNKSDGTTSATAGVAKAADVASAINNANTALSQKITDATTSLGTLGNNTFTLKADSTDTTAQALNKSGGLAFKVAGDGDLVSTSATTDTVKVTVKKGELSNAADGSLNVTDSGVVTADNMKTVVNDAITKAVTSAKDGSAWNISTNGGTATKVSGGNTVDLINGENIEITQDSTDGKKITIKTKKDLTVDSVTAGNTVINTSGLTNGTTAITGTGITTDKVTVGGLSIDKTAGINAGNKAITNVGTGIVANSNADNSNVANIGDVKTIANDAVANLSTNLGVTDGTNNGTVNLKTEKLKVVGTGAATATVNGQTVTVDVAKGTLAANAATGALTGTAGVVDANDMATAVNTAITKAVDNATGTQALNLTDGTNTGSVKLSTQTLSVSGTNGVQATVGGQGITIGLDTATKNLISNSSTAVDTLGKNTFTLKADSTDTTAQALNKSGGLAFKVAGDGDLVSTSATTDTVNVTIKKGTLSTNADGTINKATDGVVTTDNMTTVVNDAITKAVTSAKDGSAWNISTNGGTATKVSGGNTVDLINGDNIEITQDGTDGKKITVKTKKDLTLDSVTAANTVKVGSGTNLITLDGTTGGVSGNTFTAGNASMNTTGFRLTGGPSVTTTGIDAGNKVITNVASGGTTSTNAANIGDINAAISSLTTNLGKNTTIAYKANNAGGQTVSLADGFNFTNGTLTTAEVAANGVVKFNVTQGSLSTDGNGNITNTTGVATTDDVKNAVNTAITKAVDNATGTQKLDISAGGTDSSVNLKTQKLTVAGTGAATASLNGQTITVDVAQGTFTNKSDGTTSATAGVAKAADVASAINNANTALSQKITDATTSLGTLGNNTFTLKADSTDTTAQALNKSGGLAFKVAGDGDLVSTSATTDTVKVTVKKGELSNAADGSLNVTDSGVVTADNMKTVVNDAITKAVTSAKDGSAWNISTNGGTATKVSGGNTVDLINGDNIEITQDGTDGKKITVKTKKDLTLDSVTAANTVKVGSGTNLITLDGTTGGVSGNSFTAGNASMNTTGFRVTGGPSVTTAGIDAGGKQITNMISGGTVATNAATIGDVNTKVTTAINDLTTNLTKNTNIAYTANTATPGQTVSLKDGFNFTNGTLTTAEVAANGVVKFNVTQGSLSTDGNGNITNTTGVATTDDVKNAVNTAITKAVDNATGTQKLDISAGGTDSSVNLKTQKLTVAGTGAATASLNGQTITVDVAQGTFTNKSDGTTSATAGVAKAADVASAINNANTALSQKITDATTSLGTLGNNTFTLKADSTDTTAQALNKSGGLAFKVAGDGDLVSTSATTDTVKVTVKKGELSNAADGSLNVTDSGVVTADNMKTVVNDAITKAVTSAKDGSAWNISTNGGTATKVSGGNTVDLINGDNIEITQDGTDGKKITVKTKKDLTLDSVTAANTVKVGSGTNLITLDGATGGVSGNTFTAGNASMNTTGFRLTGGPSMTTTGIDAGNKVITNVASGGTTSTNAANIGDITKAISDLTTNLTKNTSISYTANTATPGQTVSLKDGFNFTNGTLTTAEVAANGVVKFNVTQGSLSTDGNGNITNTAGVATTDDVKNAVNTAINKAVTNSSTAVNTLGANTFTLTGDNSTSTTGQALNKNGGLSFKVAGDGNFITTSAATDTVTVSIKQGTFGSNTDGTAKSTTNGVATTNDVANIVNTTVTNAVTKATGSQVLNITDGTNNDSINLKNDTLKVVGADGVTTAVSGKTITVGLDTATKDKINNASTATNKNISLAADTGNASSQSLKDGDVSFAVKGATGDYISTNMNGSTVEISTKRATIDSNATTGQASVTGNDGLATAKNVADAINAATAKAVSQSAWKLAADGTTGTETISGGDTVNFKAGSNMEVSRTGKDITYKTKDNVAFTTVTAGTGANEVKLDGNTGTVTAKDITATGDVTAKNVTTSGNVTAAGTVKGDTVQGNTVKAGNVTITGGTTNTITGLSNTTWTGSTTTPDRAATEGQLQQAISSATSSATFKFDGDNNSQQTMNLQNGTFKVTGDTMITTNATSAGIGLSLNTNNVKIAYAANGTNGQTTSIASGLNFTDGDHTKATVAASGVVKYDAKTSTISVANGHAAASGNDLATADNVADAINQMTQNNAGNTTQLRQEISKVATETQRVGAHAAAMAALKPIQYDPLAPTQIMAGVGNYRGESAAALGIAHYTNDNTMFNVGVSVGGNHNMINAGVTHKFGISAEKKNIPDRYKAGPISSIYVMQDEMTQLRSENEAYKAKLDKQQSEIDALKAAVDQLLASKA